MASHIALIRGINVGRHRQVAMADLCDLFAKAGLDQARTLLRSGNVVFRSTGRTAPQLERLLEVEAARHLSLEAAFFVRSASEWSGIIRRNPFLQQAREDPAHLVVMLFKDSPGGTRIEALQQAITGRELVRIYRRHAYVVYPDGIGRSPLTHTVFEQALRTSATGRNWNTVLKLDALARG